MSENAWERMKVLNFMKDEAKVQAVDTAKEYFVWALRALEEAKINFDALIENTRSKVKEYDNATSIMNIDKLDSLVSTFTEDKTNLNKSFDTTINGFVLKDEKLSKEAIKDISEKNFNIQKVR